MTTTTTPEDNMTAAMLTDSTAHTYAARLTGAEPTSPEYRTAYRLLSAMTADQASDFMVAEARRRSEAGDMRGFMAMIPGLAP